MPPDPLEPSLFLNQLQISPAEEKNAWKQCGNYASPFKFLATPLNAAEPAQEQST